MQIIIGHIIFPKNTQKPATFRVKKETDPAVFANLGRVFSDDDNAKLPGGNLVPEKTKKSVDWSNYLGIDKRAKQDEYQGQPIYADSAVPPQTKSPPSTTASSNPNNKPVKAPQMPNAKLLAVPSTTSAKGKDSGKKDLERKENETLNKEDDRKWVLEEFYKNFAMMTNVKRKRETA